MHAPLSEKPTFREAFWFWFKLGWISFGGPAAQISIMHAEVVERRRWVDEHKFLHALNYCTLLPGPEAQQLATYLGWLMHGWRGGLVAGVFFIFPSAVILWSLSLIYILYAEVPTLSAVFYGLKIAVLALVTAAVVRLGTRILKKPIMWMIALSAFVGLSLGVSFPWLVLGAALGGGLIGWAKPEWFVPVQMADGAHEPFSFRRTALQSILTFGICLAAWVMPLLLVTWAVGSESAISRMSLFFSKTALITFGGAYAVLPYVADQATRVFLWLTPAQMISGMALAETTPGPLIMVLQFVGFVGAWQSPGHLPPLVAATLGAFVSTWATFAPSFLYIFVGAPYVEWLQRFRTLSYVLSSITAAVVGVILSLAIWFGGHFLLPDGKNFDLFAAVASAVAFLVVVRWKPNTIFVIISCSLAGLSWRWFGF